MLLLQWLSALRTPFLDQTMLIITELGGETGFIAVIFVVLWCLNKDWGYQLFFSWGCGTGLNQFLKAACAVPRPWVADPTFSPVASAIPDAGGYSFPSGHTQSVFGLFGTLALLIRRRFATVTAAVLIALVAFSRMYLGVHTPWDILGSVAIGCAVLAVQTVLLRMRNKAASSWIACGIFLTIAFGNLLFALLQGTPSNPEAAHALENGWKLLGAAVGMAVAWQLDRTRIHFSVKAHWFAQILKLAVGLAVALGIKALKLPLHDLIGNTGIADCLRYLLLSLWAGLIYPITFRFWSKLSFRKHN